MDNSKTVTQCFGERIFKSCEDKRQCLEEKLIDKNSEYRSRVLNIVESHLGSDPNWKIIRSQLLRLFGERGFCRDIKQIVDGVFFGGGR